VTVTILAEHPRWVVVSKPSGLPVHRSKMVRSRDALLQRVRDQVNCRVHPIHRLDRPTSGCVLFAKDSEMAARLQAAMSHPQSIKTYLIGVRGTATPGTGALLDIPLRTEGKIQEAQTYIECLGSVSEPRCSLFLARPRTGRWHQIRRHMVRISMPVLLDSTHGDTRVNRWWRDNTGLSRLAMHCASLNLRLPHGESLVVQCPIPEDLAKPWQALGWWRDLVRQHPEWIVPSLQETDSQEPARTVLPTSHDEAKP